MKLVKALMFSTVLFLAPTAAFAGGVIGDFTADFLDDTAPAPVPEPSGLLVMGIALGAAALVRRQRR